MASAPATATTRSVVMLPDVVRPDDVSPTRRRQRGAGIAAAKLARRESWHRVGRRRNRKRGENVRRNGVGDAPRIEHAARAPLVASARRHRQHHLSVLIDLLPTVASALEADSCAILSGDSRSSGR
jgi:hypothetical protein